MTITAEITTVDDVPAHVTLKDGNKNINVEYSATGFTITGSSRSLTPEMLELLKLIYPAQQKLDFSIPQPLQTIQLKTGGAILLNDDMENLLKWTASAGTVATDNTVAYTGDQSIKVTSLAAGADAEVERGFIWSNHKLKILEVLFAIADTAKSYRLHWSLYRFLDFAGLEAGVRYDTVTKKWAFANSAGAYEDIPSSEGPGLEDISTLNIWHSLRLAISEQAYKFMEIDGKRFDLSNKQLNIFSSANLDHSYVWLHLEKVPGEDAICYYDNIKVLGEN